MKSILSALTLFFTLGLICVPTSTYALVSSSDSLSFQGYVTDEFGVPIDTPSVSILFKIYKDGTSVWDETHPSVAISGGVFNVLLGSITPMDTVAFKGEMTLGITLGGNSEIVPRTPLASTAFARALPAFYTYYRDDGVFTKAYNVVGGDPMNVVDPGASGVTISGGGGTWNNDAQPNSAAGDFATVAGGSDNSAAGAWSTVSGGSLNTSDNTVATVGGGQLNEASGVYATIGGGRQNEATGDYASIAGGWTLTASNSYSTVAGGYNNDVSGEGSTIGGGTNNTITGDYSIIPGGATNLVEGNTSFAAGFKAFALHDRSFVWNGTLDSNDTLKTTTTDQFLARAANGFQLYTGEAVGAELTGGSGSWGSFSDVNAKTGFGRPDPAEVLSKLVAMPVQTWRYREQDESIRHMGPTAQDFRDAFGLGYDDRHIVTVDADGVSFAAIQGLYELVMKQQAEIERLRELVEGGATSQSP